MIVRRAVIKYSHETESFRLLAVSCRLLKNGYFSDRYAVLNGIFLLRCFSPICEELPAGQRNLVDVDPSSLSLFLVLKKRKTD